MGPTGGGSRFALSFRRRRGNLERSEQDRLTGRDLGMEIRFGIVRDAPQQDAPVFSGGRAGTRAVRRRRRTCHRGSGGHIRRQRRRAVSTQTAWPSDEPASLAALRAIGATVARTDTFWATAEPQPPVNGVHTYDWTYDDKVATALGTTGLRWQAIVDYATWWAADSGGGQNPGVAPGYVGDYAAYAQAFAHRYGQGGTFWAQHPTVRPEPVQVFEIWNEPDMNMFWEPATNLAEYAQMYLVSRAAIHAVDPTASVIIGGLVYASTSLPALVADEPSLRGNVDGVAIHPYRDTADQTMQAVADDLSLDASTVAAPMYINEYGWNGSRGPGRGRPRPTASCTPRR